MKTNVAWIQEVILVRKALFYSITRNLLEKYVTIRWFFVVKRHIQGINFTASNFPF